MNAAWTSLLIFVACYALFVVFPARRSVVAMAGALLLVVLGIMPWREALFVQVNWNVMGLFFGTLILAELFMLSRVPALMAAKLVDSTSTARGAMLALCALAGAVSMVVENVAVVLLVAPVALSLAEKLKTNPVPLLIGIAVSSNLQGTATMIGDPPSMILAGHMRMSFLDFFVYHGKPGIFVAVQIGAVASLAVLAWLFRRHGEATRLVEAEKARSWFPAFLLVLLVAGLSLATLPDPGFVWFAGAYTMALALAALLWLRFKARWLTWRVLFRDLDWDTTFFLIGVFVVVGGLTDSGWLDRLARVLSAAAGGHLFLAFAGILVLSVLVSGFVDNVPFLLAMIPVAQKVAEGMNAPAPLLLFALLIGTCLGGNLTPIGASANVVTVGLLRKRGHTVTFRDFAAVGLPFTAAAVLAGGLFVWWIWAP